MCYTRHVKDYYATLGLDSTASTEDIKRAFKKLAMHHHPDRGGDGERFAAINEAYAVLSDPARRENYDHPNHVHINFGDAPSGFTFDNFFDTFVRGTRHQQRPQTYRMQLWTALQDVAKGGRRVVALNTVRGVVNIEIVLPPGYEDGDSVRYPRLGPDSGDLVVTFRIKADNTWQRNGPHVTTEKIVPIWNLILGTTVNINTLEGSTLSLSVPARTQPGTLLRLKQQGLPDKNSSTRGDMLVKIQTVLPETIPDAIVECIRQNGVQ